MEGVIVQLSEMPIRALDFSSKTCAVPPPSPPAGLERGEMRAERGGRSTTSGKTAPEIGASRVCTPHRAKIPLGLPAAPPFGCALPPLRRQPCTANRTAPYYVLPQQGCGDYVRLPQHPSHAVSSGGHSATALTSGRASVCALSPVKKSNIQSKALSSTRYINVASTTSPAPRAKFADSTKP